MHAHDFQPMVGKFHVGEKSALIVMSARKRETTTQATDLLVSAETELCQCLPFFTLPKPDERDANDSDNERWTPIPEQLRTQLLAQLERYFPRSTPFSLLLLHVSQLDPVSFHPQSATLHKRQRFHAPEGFLDQALVNVRRALRRSDQLLIQPGAGAVILLPNVDEQGAYTILERVYRNISLLQSETVIPPLRRETEILLGKSTYPTPATSSERLLTQLSLVVRSFTLRSAITMQWQHGEPDEQLFRQDEAAYLPGAPANFTNNKAPFMGLPERLSPCLRAYIPHHIALELRCVPVGRDHHNLTVAMSDPSDEDALRQLQKITGKRIFPVSCDPSALDMLLATQW